MDIGLGIALLAGFLSFASPCVLPIVPGYLTFITGMSFDELTERQGGSQGEAKICGIKIRLMKLSKKRGVPAMPQGEH